MQKTFVAAVVMVTLASMVLLAQRRVPFNGKTDSTLTVETQSPAEVGGWWPAFVEQNTLEGYCWNLKYPFVAQEAAQRQKSNE